MSAYPTTNTRIKTERINTLRQALFMVENESEDDAQVARIRGALIDVMIDAVLPRTETAIAEAQGVISERRARQRQNCQNSP